MHLEIVNPEQTLLSQEVNSVTLPGITGEFQLLNSHAPIVSTLAEGKLKLEKSVELSEKVKAIFNEEGNKLFLEIKGGVVECKDNKVIVLID